MDQPKIHPDVAMGPTSFDRAAHCRQIAHKGGAATRDKYGREFYVQMGKRGFATYAERYHDGNRGAARVMLDKRAQAARVKLERARSAARWQKGA